MRNGRRLAPILLLSLSAPALAIPGATDRIPAASLLVPFFETGIDVGVNPHDTLLAVNNQFGSRAHHSLPRVGHRREPHDAARQRDSRPPRQLERGDARPAQRRPRGGPHRAHRRRFLPRLRHHRRGHRVDRAPPAAGRIPVLQLQRDRGLHLLHAPGPGLGERAGDGAPRGRRRRRPTRSSAASIPRPTTGKRSMRPGGGARTTSRRATACGGRRPRHRSISTCASSARCR